jgi:hypothetical protein
VTATCLLAGCISIGEARDLMGNVVVEGRPIVVYSDGSWRFDDSLGDVCTTVSRVGQVCAIPSEWSPLPLNPENDEAIFWNESGFLAKVNVLPLRNTNYLLTTEDPMAFILNRSFSGGLQGLQIEKSEASIGDAPGKTLVIHVQGRGVIAFTYAFVEERAIIAQTSQSNTTLFLSDHRKAHKGFLSAIKIRN